MPLRACEHSATGNLTTGCPHCDEPSASLPLPRAFWCIAGLVALGAITGVFHWKNVPARRDVREITPAVQSYRAVSPEEARDRDAARAVCGKAVERMIGDLAGDQLKERSEYPVDVVAPGVLAVRVGKRVKEGASGYLCQATNQAGVWETEFVSEIQQ